MALPELPTQGQNPWYSTRTTWDTAVKTELEGRLSPAALEEFVRSVVSELLGYIIPPSGFKGFTHLPNPRITYNAGTDSYTLDFNYSSLIPTGGVVYYVSPDAPASGNDGLSVGAPIRIPAAIAKADVGEIRYAAGEYYFNNHSRGSGEWMITRPIRHIASGPGVKVTGFQTPSSTGWTLVSGFIYSASRSAAQEVFDVVTLDGEDYTKYTKKATLAEITGAGQVAIVGSTVYIWAFDNADMTLATDTGQRRVRIQTTSNVGVATAGPTQYVEGIAFEGSTSGAITSGSSATMILKNVSVKYGSLNGITVTGGSVISDTVTVARSGTDGFNYHVYSPATYCEFIEINCIGRNNGQVSGATTNNSTTAHETAVGIRVNGIYSTSHGPVLADVNNAQSWNLGCTSGDSTTATLSQSAAFRVDATGFTGDIATIWLERCKAVNVDKGLHATGGGIIYTRLTSFSGVTTNEFVASGGVIAPY